MCAFAGLMWPIDNYYSGGEIVINLGYNMRMFVNMPVNNLW